MFTKTNLDGVDTHFVDNLETTVKNIGYELKPEKMRVNVWELEAGDSMVLHRQIEQEELYLILDGAGEMQVGDEEFEIVEGDVIVISPDAWRDFTATEDLRVFAVGAPNVKDDGVQVTDVPEEKYK